MQLGQSDTENGGYGEPTEDATQGTLSDSIDSAITKATQDTISTSADIQDAQGIPVDPDSTDNIDASTTRIIADAAGIARQPGSDSLEKAEREMVPSPLFIYSARE